MDQWDHMVPLHNLTGCDMMATLPIHLAEGNKSWNRMAHHGDVILDGSLIMMAKCTPILAELHKLLGKGGN